MVPDCNKCGYVLVVPENIHFVHLIDKYSKLLFDSNAAKIDTSAIELIHKIEFIEDLEVFIEKVTVYFSMILKKRYED